MQLSKIYSPQYQSFCDILLDSIDFIDQFEGENDLRKIEILYAEVKIKLESGCVHIRCNKCYVLFFSDRLLGVNFCLFETTDQLIDALMRMRQSKKKLYHLFKKFKAFKKSLNDG